MNFYVREFGTDAIYRDDGWDIGILAGSQVNIQGKKVLGERGFAIGSPTGGSTIDEEARVAIGEILVAMREHGLIEI